MTNLIKKYLKEVILLENKINQTDDNNFIIIAKEKIYILNDVIDNLISLLAKGED